MAVSHFNGSRHFGCWPDVHVCTICRKVPIAAAAIYTLAPLASHACRCRVGDELEVIYTNLDKDGIGVSESCTDGGASRLGVLGETFRKAALSAAAVTGTGCEATDLSPDWRFRCGWWAVNVALGQRGRQLRAGPHAEPYLYCSHSAFAETPTGYCLPAIGCAISSVSPRLSYLNSLRSRVQVAIMGGVEVCQTPAVQAIHVNRGTVAKATELFRHCKHA